MPHRFKGERTLMRIFIGESDKYQGKPLYAALLERVILYRPANARNSQQELHRIEGLDPE
jgi:hypothetical protein